MEGPISELEWSGVVTPERRRTEVKEHFHFDGSSEKEERRRPTDRSISVKMFLRHEIYGGHGFLSVQFASQNEKCS